MPFHSSVGSELGLALCSLFGKRKDLLINANGAAGGYGSRFLGELLGMSR